MDNIDLAAINERDGLPLSDIPDMRIHHLRHTCAWLLVSCKASLEMIGSSSGIRKLARPSVIHT